MTHTRKHTHTHAHMQLGGKGDVVVANSSVLRVLSVPQPGKQDHSIAVHLSAPVMQGLCKRAHTRTHIHAHASTRTQLGKTKYEVLALKFKVKEKLKAAACTF